MRLRRVGVVVLAVATVVGCKPMVDGATGGDANTSSAVRAWPYPVVWVEDHTGSSWPVTTAVAQWDSGTDQSIRYGRCRAHAGCIRVFEADKGDNGNNGLTTTEWSGRVMVSASVTLNDHYAGDGPEVRLATTCHEIGHGLGLPHNPSRGSCLYENADLATRAAPDTHDRAELNDAWHAAQAAAKAGSR